MSNKVSHSSIGANIRSAQEQISQAIAKRREKIDRYNRTPWRDFGIDQLSVWVLWLTVATSVFLFCTVSAVVIAVR